MPNNGIPAPRVAVLEQPNTIMSRSWYRYLYNLFSRFVEATGILKTTFGGTGLGAYLKGDMIYASADDVLARVAKPDVTSMLTMTGTGVPAWQHMSYGAFSSTSTQSATVANAAYRVIFNRTDLTNDVTLVNGTQITCTHAGVYNIQFSAQLDKTGGAGAGLVWIWARVDGVDVPYSASQVRLQNTTSETVPAWNWVLSIPAGGYFELMWATDDTTCVLQAQSASGVVPVIPSVILTVTQA